MDVLVTGSRGAIGRVVVAALRARGHRVRGFDRAEDGPDGVRGDLTDAAALTRAVEGMQAVVHLAATPDEADPLTSIIPNNIVGLYHVLEAARIAGAKRVVLASSVRAAVGSWDHRSFLPADAAPAPHDFYSWSKGAGELMGQLYGTRRGLSVLAVRIAFFPRDRKEWSWMDAKRHLQQSYLGWRDAGSFFCAAVEAPHDPGFATVFAAGKGAIGLLDLATTERLLGWTPRDAYPDGTPEITGG